MEFRTIEFIVIIILAIIGVTGWFVFLYKKNRLLTKSTSKEIKSGLFSFVNLIILSIITTSIAVGLQMSYVNSKNTLDNINIEHNVTHAEMQKTGVELNRERVMHFPKYSVDSDKASADGLHPDATWTSLELVPNRIESFPEWIENLISDTAVGSKDRANVLANNLIFNVEGLYDHDVDDNFNHGVWSDDNVFGMYIYIINMLNKYPHTKIDHELGFSFEFALEMDWYKNESDVSSSGTIKLVKKSDKDSSMNKPAKGSSPNSKKHYVNDVMYNNLSGNVTTGNDDIYLESNQTIVSSTFSKKNNIKNGDKIYYSDSAFDKKQELTMVGNGIMSSDLVVKPTNLGPAKDPKIYSFAFIDDELFNNILITKLWDYHQDAIIINSKQTIRKSLVEIGFIMYDRIGYAAIYDRIDADIVDYNDDGFYSELPNSETTKVLSGNNVHYITREIIGEYATVPEVGSAVETEYTLSIEGVKKRPCDGVSSNALPSVFFNSILDSWNTNSEVNRYSIQYDKVNMQKTYSGPLTLIFIITNIVIIFMFVKRIIKENIPNIATLKAIGHRTSKITASYTIYPLLITIIGGAFGIVLALGLQKVFMASLLGPMAMPTSATYLTIGAIFWNFAVPVVVTTVLITIMMYVFLKNNTFSAMKGETEGKPNILVRGWSKISPSNFMITYRVKNTLRSFGKSTFILVSIFLSSTLLILGGTFNAWQDQATEISVQSWMGDAEAINWTTDSSKVSHTFETVEQTDAKIADGTYEPYTFTNTPGISTEQFLSIMLAGESGKGELETWKNEVGSYLVEETMEGKYITSGIDLAAIWNNEGLAQEEAEAAIIKIVNGVEGIFSRTKFKAELAGKVGLAYANLGGEPCLQCAISKLFEILEAWSLGNRHEVGLNPSRKPDDAIVITSSEDILTGIVELIFSISLLDLEDGYIGALLHTLAIEKTFVEYKPGFNKPNVTLDDPLEITYENSLGNDQTVIFDNASFNDISAKLKELFIAELVYTALNNLDVFKEILAGNEIPIGTEYELTKILPGIKTFEEGNSFLLKFSIESLLTTTMNSAAQLNLIYDENSINHLTTNLFEQEVTLETKTNEYIENNVKNVDNGHVYIPSTVAYMDYFAMTTYPGNEVGSIKSTSLPSEWLDWSREKSSGNPDYTWIEYPMSQDEFNWQNVQNIFGKQNDKFVVPVLYDSDGEDKEFGIVSQVVGIFETYVPTGDMYYANEHGMGDFISTDTYNMIALVPDETGELKITNEYQNFWSNDWDVNKPNKWTLLDATKPQMAQPISTYGTGVEVPLPLSALDTIVTSQYEDIATTTRLFTITSIIVIVWIIIILIKEIIDGTKKEASILKALGYQDFKASSLIVDGSNIMMIIGALLAIPFVMLIISSINAMFTTIFSLPVNMVISFSSFALVGVIVAVLIIITYLLSHISFKKVSPLEAINRT